MPSEKAMFSIVDCGKWQKVNNLQHHIAEVTKQFSKSPIGLRFVSDDKTMQHTTTTKMIVVAIADKGSTQSNKILQVILEGSYNRIYLSSQFHDTVLVKSKLLFAFTQQHELHL